MKLDSSRLANTLAVLGAVWYVICWLLVSAMPAVYRGVATSWMHGFNLTGLPAASPNVNQSIYGLVTFVAASWLTGYAFASIYNALGKK
ncbi:MAG: DUF5676 family membrane protein [bacterium]|nr:DUF5676 family membrane protein [bacterium]